MLVRQTSASTIGTSDSAERHRTSGRCLRFLLRDAGRLPSGRSGRRPLVEGFVSRTARRGHGRFVRSIRSLAAPHGRDRRSGVPVRWFAATQPAHRRRIACDRSNGHRQPRGMPRAFDRRRSTVANRAQRFVSLSLIGVKSEGEVAAQRLALFGEPGRRLAGGENE